MNPLNLIISWPVVFVAVTSLLLTQVCKVAIDYLLSSDRASPRAAVRGGADLRRQHPVLSQVVVPALPVFFGVVIALVVPLRPEALEAWVGLRREPWWLAYYVWGAYCGMLADYAFSHFHDLRRALRTRAG